MNRKTTLRILIPLLALAISLAPPLVSRVLDSLLPARHSGIEAAILLLIVCPLVALMARLVGIMAAEAEGAGKSDSQRDLEGDREA